MSGRVFYNIALSTTEGSYPLDCSSLASGVYEVVLLQDGKPITHNKLIIK